MQRGQSSLELEQSKLRDENKQAALKELAILKEQQLAGLRRAREQALAKRAAKAKAASMMAATSKAGAQKPPQSNRKELPTGSNSEVSKHRKAMKVSSGHLL